MTVTAVDAKPLCPGCEEVVRETTFEDAAGRPWHRDHALRALAETFRTPLSIEDATVAISFECRGGDSHNGSFTAPHSFHLREVEFLDDAEISNMFVGASAMVCVPMSTIRSWDLPDHRLVVDRDVPIGYAVSMVGAPDGFRYRLIGERRPERQRPRPSTRKVLAAFALSAERVEPGEVATGRFWAQGDFRGERVCLDDWAGWEVAAVRVGTDPGRVFNKAVRLTGHSTDVNTYEARADEMLEYDLRNVGETVRALDGRVYGTMRFS